jgi:hypothetical protein
MHSSHELLYLFVQCFDSIGSELHIGMPGNSSSPANLGPANLGLVYLRPANLGPANLGPANLGPANLGPANLGPVNLGPQVLAEARPRQRRRHRLRRRDRARRRSVRPLLLCLSLSPPTLSSARPYPRGPDSAQTPVPRIMPA